MKTKIVQSETEYVAGEMSETRCRTFGSRPAAYITWWKDNERLPDSSNTVTHLTQHSCPMHVVVKVFCRQIDIELSMSCNEN